MKQIDISPLVESLAPSTEAYRALLEKLVKTVSAERGCFYLERENKLLYHGDDLLRERFPFTKEAVLSVLDEGRAFLCLDSANAPRSISSGSIMVNSVRSVLCAAARDANGEILVLAYFDNKGTSGCFSLESLKTLKRVLGQVPGAIPEPEGPDAPPIPEVGVVVWHEGQLAMVASHGSENWGIPKGKVEGGDPDVRGRASLVAWQEVGVTGTLSEPLGSYLYSANELNYRVKLFELPSAKLHDEWPDFKIKQRRFLSPADACALIEEPGLRTLILRRAAQQPDWDEETPPLPYFSNEFEEATREYLKPFADMLSDPTEENLGLALELLMEEHFAERGCLWIESEGTRSLIYRGDEELRERFPFSRQVVDTALKTGQGFVSFNSQADDRLEPDGSIMFHGVRSVLCTAARDPEGQALAVVYLDNKSSAGNFTDEDLKLLDQVMALYPGAQLPEQRA